MNSRGADPFWTEEVRNRTNSTSSGWGTAMALSPQEWGSDVHVSTWTWPPRLDPSPVVCQSTTPPSRYPTDPPRPAMTVKVARPAAWSSGWLTSRRYVRHGDWQASQQQSSSTTPTIVSRILYVARQPDFTAAAVAVSSVKPASSIKLGSSVVVLLRNFRCCFLNLPRRRSPYVLPVSSRLLRSVDIFVVLILPVADTAADASSIHRKI